jgi:hypothetical protein
MSETDTGIDSLAEFVRTSVASGVSRRALLLRTDRLPESSFRSEQMRSARAALAPLISADRAARHDLPGGRLVISWKGDPGRLLGQAMDGLARLLQENPMDAPSLQELICLYELPSEGEALMTAATAGLHIIGVETNPPADETQAAVAATLQPLQPAELDRLEKSLAGTDLSRFARRRPVCHFDGQTAQLAWEERSLSIPELIDTVAPGRDARSDVWLFRRLTRVLDRRMLSILSDPKELRGAGPFNLTLNVASVLSPEFLRFDAALPAAFRSRLVISFLPVDIASDAAAFGFARNFARGRSYRVCLRAVSKRLLAALDLEALDLDFIQLIWSPDLAELSALPPAGNARWIVGQPCTQEAVEWGLKRSISLFTIKPSE